MAHIIRENAGKKFKKISELFINKNFEYTFVLFVSDQSLGCFFHPKNLKRENDFNYDLILISIPR
jgi:hypothetical protein